MSATAQNQKDTREDIRSAGIYTENMYADKVILDFDEVGGNISNIIEEKLRNTHEGKCGPHGYVKPDSLRIMKYSSGDLYANRVRYDVAYSCLVCNPVEGTKIRVKVKSITKAGIRAERDEEQSPVVVFVSRDHHYNNEHFSKVSEGDDIRVKIIGTRFELNDTYISIIAELDNSDFTSHNKRARVRIE